MKSVIEIKDLEKKYPGFSLSINELNIPAGVITGLIGENGAGKTTLIKTILNIIKKDNGSIKMFNKDYIKEELDIKEDIGVVLDEGFFPDILNCRDINSIMGSIYKSWDSAYFNDYLNKFEIKDNQILKAMSRGMKKKVEIVTALAHKPKLLILDEATSGLDPIVRNEILDLFLDFIKDDDHSVILSTHITSDLEHIADHIVFINKGNIVLEKSTEEIIDNYGILKCSIDDFDKIDKKDIIKFRKNKYDYQILIDDKRLVRKKYKKYIVDDITIEDLMLLVVKGEE